MSRRRCSAHADGALLSSTAMGFPPPTTTLFRPVGQRELELIRESGFRAFPPRLPHQPIFYPVLNEEYATSIARDWNTKDAASGFVGYVTRFAVDTEYVQQFPIHTVVPESTRNCGYPPNVSRSLMVKLSGESKLSPSSAARVDRHVAYVDAVKAPAAACASPSPPRTCGRRGGAGFLKAGPGVAGRWEGVSRPL